MSKFFLGAFVAFFVMFLATVAFAQEAETPTSTLYQKPVICAPTQENAVKILQQIKKDGMKPLMYFRGNSFNNDGSRFNSDIFILFDGVEIVTVVEIQNNGFTCVLSGGTGNVEFDPDILRDLIGWENIP